MHVADDGHVIEGLEGSAGVWSVWRDQVYTEQLIEAVHHSTYILRLHSMQQALLRLSPEKN